MTLSEVEQDVMLSVREYSELWSVVASLRTLKGGGSDSELIAIARPIVLRFVSEGLAILTAARKGTNQSVERRLAMREAQRVLEQDSSWQLEPPGDEDFHLELTDAGTRAVRDGAIADAERRIRRER